MSNPVRLLVLSKDNTLFTGGSAVQGDARRRHILYAGALRDRFGPDSEIRILTHTRVSSGHRRDNPAPGLKLYGTASIHRATYLADVLALLPTVLADGWRPTAISTQTPWEEGVVGALLARMLKTTFLPQLHFDLFSDEWRREKRLNALNQAIAVRVLRTATRLRVVSAPLKAKVLEHLDIAADAIDVIPVGVNFKPSKLSAPDAKKQLDPRLDGRQVVLFVGRLTAQKNLHLWLDVADEVLRAAPETRFVLVGDGEQDHDLRRIIARREQHDRILMVGPVGHERLPDVYAAADLFLLTSHYEGFGRVLLEAGFAGVPSVATRSVGPEDIIDHGVSGFLADRGDRDALIGGCLSIISDPTKRDAMGNAARCLAEDRFGLDALAARLSHHWAGA